MFEFLEKLSNQSLITLLILAVSLMGSALWYFMKKWLENTWNEFQEELRGNVSQAQKEMMLEHWQELKQETLSTIQQEFTKTIDSSTGKVSKVITKLDEVSEKIDDSYESFRNRLNDIIENTKNRVDKLQDQLRHVDTEMRNTSDEVRRLQDRLSNLHSTVSEDFRSKQGEWKDYQEQIQSVTTELRNIETSIQELHLENRPEDVWEKFQEGHKSLQKQNSVIDNKIETLLNTIEQASKPEQSESVTLDAIYQKLNSLAEIREDYSPVEQETAKSIQNVDQIISRTVEKNEQNYEYFPVLFEERCQSLEKRPWRSAAFYNYKGGVGKTTIAFNIAHDLVHRHGLKVLVIDLDPQANLSLFTLGEEAYSEAHWTVPRILNYTYGKKDYSLNFKACKERSIHLDSLHIIPNLAMYQSLEETMVRWYCQGEDPRKIWVDMLNESGNSYDYIIFDCPPNMGFMSQSALIGADAIFMPITPGDFSLYGIGTASRSIQKFRKTIGREGHGLKGVILNRFPVKNNEFSPVAEEEILRYKGGSLEIKRLVFPDVIPDAPGASIYHSGTPMTLKLRDRRTILLDLAVETLQKTTDTFLERMKSLTTTKEKKNAEN